jgi:hypothetical protein
LAKIRAAEINIGVGELWMVENIEKLPTKLNADIFMRAQRVEILDESHIHIPVRGAAEGIL